MNKSQNIKINSFKLQSGEQSGHFEISCCLYGALDKPVVVVLGGISANRWILDSVEDGKKGWWQDVLGQSSFFNLNDYCFLGLDYFCFSESYINPPLISTEDQANILKKIQQQLNLPQFHAVIGSSYGGMVSLAFAAQYPSDLENLICIAAADHNSVKSQALRKIQRDIIRLGQNLNLDVNKKEEFLALARSLAMVGYRGEQEWEQRFQDKQPGSSLHKVTSYLRYHGEKFAKAFKPSKYCQLSKSIDYHSIDVKKIKAKTLLIGFTSDQLVPTAFIRNMEQQMGHKVYSYFIDSIFGHDGFLLESEQINQIIHQFFIGQYNEYFKSNNRCASGY